MASELNIENQLINEAAAAGYLSVSIRTVQAMRYTGGGPRYVRLGRRCIRYRLSDLNAWADERTYQNTSEYQETV